MRADAVQASRSEEVRAAARAWQRKGVVDRTMLVTVEKRYADDRHRLGSAFRAMMFVFAFIAGNAAFGLLVLVFHPRGDTTAAAFCLFWAVVLAGATETLVGPMKRAESGLEEALALLAVGYGAIGAALLVDEPFSGNYPFFDAFVATCAVLGLLGAWRWGLPFLAAGAAVAAYVLLARLDHGRLLFILVSTLASPLLLRASESVRFPPPHRVSSRVTLVIAILALYVAVHLGSWDRGLIEAVAHFRDYAEPTRHEAARTLSILATCLLPVIVLAFGVRTRRAYLMDLGVLLGLASLVTLRFYVHVAPVWVVLVGSGTAALLAAMAVRRWLASGPGQERGGLTAEPLFEDPRRRHATEIAGVIATLGPAAREIPAAREDTLTPGGGRFGGGGAGGSY